MAMTDLGMVPFDAIILQRFKLNNDEELAKKSTAFIEERKR